MTNISNKLLITTSNSFLCIDTMSQQITKIHTGKGLYYGITFDKNYIYVGARNRLVSSEVDSTDEEGSILKFDHRLQLIKEIKPSFPLRDIHQIRMISGKLYVTCSYDNMIAVYDGTNWERWYPNDIQGEDRNHFNSIYSDDQYIYILAHNWGDSEVNIFALEDRKLIKKIKIGKYAHNVWLDDENTIYTLSSEESKMVTTDNSTNLILEGFPRGIVMTNDRLYVGISERAERKRRDFVDGKILIFDNEQNKIGNLHLASEGMVSDIKILNQEDHISHESIHVDEYALKQITTQKWKYNDSRETIKKRLEIYLSFLLPLKKIYSENLLIDIDCQRGEWVELLTEKNIKVLGTDLDEWKLNTCREKNLNVEQGNGIDILQKQASKSLMAVTLLHVIDHKVFDNIKVLISEALRTLKPGGILIIETINPECMDASLKDVDLNIGHTPSNLLSFLESFSNIKRSKILNFQEEGELKKFSKQFVTNVRHVVEGVSYDYAIVIQKDAEYEISQILDNAFEKEYQMTLLELSEKFEIWMQSLHEDIAKVNRRAKNAEADIHKTWARTDMILKKLDASIKKSNEIEKKYHLILNSTSWKLTKPIRVVKDTIKKFLRK